MEFFKSSMKTIITLKKKNNNNLLASLNDPSPKNAQFILTISLPLPHNDEGVYNTAMI